ncbi:hypothetical protein SAMN04487996_12848 [Dyadobacter soli]|uniref:Uncharacterized protein n=1 Tax=Dyadobacter soli TaxID=659014 RepID=A0A1G7ZJ86_9BACT|nr:hypothetical protein [Dyadobacter soli]SDH08758.1 hypothetical protein SAMN04487996_12848 [Dyadobacter soli]
MKVQKKSIFDCASEIRTVKSLGLPTNPLFEKKRLDAIELIQRTQLIEQIRRKASQD